MHYASVENLTKSFGIRTLFRNITINIEEGDKIALVARNGSGKSTLMKIIAGMDTADTGTVWVHKDIRTVMLQQDNDFDGQKTIWDNVLRLDNPVVKVVKEYEQFLECLKEKGVFLIDIINLPLEIRKKDKSLNQENIDKLISDENLNDLDKRINSLIKYDKKVIFLLARTKYLKKLKTKFPNYSFITWKCFRLDITEAKDCKKNNPKPISAT
jgi:ATP-binding cassette subfamily F protein uup